MDHRVPYTLTVVTETGEFWGKVDCLIPDSDEARAFVNTMMGVGRTFRLRRGGTRSKSDLPGNREDIEVGIPGVISLDLQQKVCNPVCILPGITVTVPAGYGGNLFPDYTYAPNYIPDSGSDFDSYDPNGCDPSVSLDCLQPLHPNDVKAIREAVKQLEDTFAAGFEDAAAKCEEMSTKLASLLAGGNVYRGKTDDPVQGTGVHSGPHVSAWWNGNMHLDPGYISGMHGAMTTGQKKDLLNSMLHESAHALGKDHTSPVGGMYVEPYFNLLHQMGSNNCIKG